MRCYTQQECEEWLSGRQRRKPDAEPSLHREHIHYPRDLGRVLYLARWIAAALTFRKPALLWITEWSIWIENWHLYYKLRQSYSDHRLLHEAPGHPFLEHETEDLASFLQVAFMNGWGGYFLAHADYINAFFSHDGYINFFAEREESLAEARKEFGAEQEKAE